MPPLAFSYTTGRAFSDIPLPDYTYWSLPYADLPPWESWLDFTRAPANGWGQKLDQMIWVGSPTNPLRSSFASCASRVFGARLVHRMPKKDAMHELAWRCKPSAPNVPCPTKPADWTPLQEQCRYRYILHLPGISDWLEHFKHQLACGSVNIFIGVRPPEKWRRTRANHELGAPASFEHFDLSGPLLAEGEHFVHVHLTLAPIPTLTLTLIPTLTLSVLARLESGPAPCIEPQRAALSGSRQVPISGGGNGVCRQLQNVLEQLESHPQRAQCIARAGQRLSGELHMERVYSYMSGVLREASQRQQPDVARRVVRAERSRRVTKHNYFSFIPPAKRPWMEHIFVPWHRERFNTTPFLPPHGAEEASGLFH